MLSLVLLSSLAAAEPLKVLVLDLQAENVPESTARIVRDEIAVDMGLRSGVTFVERDLALVRAMLDQAGALQQSLDEAALAGKQRLYLSGPISSDDPARNLDLLRRAEKHLVAGARTLLGVEPGKLMIVNPGGYQNLLPRQARGNHFMWVWERVLLGNEGGNFEHVSFLGDAWTARLYREARAEASGRRLANVAVDDPRYLLKGVQESAGSRFEWMDVRAVNQARRRAGKPPVRVYEDGRLLAEDVASAPVELTTYEKRGEVTEAP